MAYTVAISEGKVSQEVLHRGPTQMPVPNWHGDGKVPVPETHLEACLLAALDLKFAQQEAVLRGLITPGALLPLASLASRSSFETSGSAGSHSQAVVEPDSDVILADEWSSSPKVSYHLSEPSSDAKSRLFSKAANTLGAQVMKEKWVADPPFKAFVKGQMDLYIGVVVIVHVVAMILNAQWIGSQADFSVGLSDQAWPGLTQEAFDIAEYVFFGFYVLDVGVRVAVLRREWWYDPVRGRMYLNLLDAALVSINFTELIIVPAVVGDEGQLSANQIRLIKLSRVARTLRVMKSLSLFRQLRHLVGTCVASIGALFWSIVLILLCQLTFALIICQALQPFILDDQADFEARLQMNSWYGSFFKAMYTTFEITLSGGWPLLVRPVVEYVDAGYAALFLPYIAVVVFAILRIVTALFIKETLQSAANDAEMVMEESRSVSLKYQRRLEELFCVVDDDGDGNLTLEEFRGALSMPSVSQYLLYMDVTVRDCEPLFEILAEGDGLITITEFCKGIMQLKGQARALDIVMLQHENSKLMAECKQIRRALLTLSKAFRRPA